MTGFRKKFLLIIFASLLSITAYAGNFRPAKNVPYKTFLFNMQELPNLRSAILESSLLVKGESNLPENIEILKNRAQDDMLNIQKILASYGYYDAELDYFVDERSIPVRVYIKITLGPLYTIGAFKIKSDPANTNLVEVLASDIEKVGISLGQPAEKTRVQQATLNTLNYLKNHGYPFAALKSDRIVVDRSKKEMQVALLIKPGGMARFGNTVLQENGGTTADFIKARLAWKRGDIYNEEKVIKTIQTFFNTKLFKEVKITHDERVDGGGFVNLYLKLVGSDRNIVRPVISFTPGIGLEPGVSWERRNLTNNGDILTASTVIGKDIKYGHLKYVIPDFKTLDLNLTNDLDIHSNDLKPYTISGWSLLSMLDYPTTSEVTLKGGAGLDADNLSVSGSRKDYRYLKSVLEAKFSNIEHEATPKQGIRGIITLTPYLRILSRLSGFIQLTVNPDFYIPLSPEIILHGWAQIDASPGAGENIVPAHKLFYGMIRGYKYQMAGPLSNGVPIGGRSALSMGGELEYYCTDLMSILAFADFGTTYDRQFPDFKTSLLSGVGAGLRYRSGWGTWRLDVASPMNRRSQDSSFEIYAGLDRPI